ncbi:hypothetical protein [Pseudokineococcus sp. 1T1Z-3]|uniref:hypothetical protein n=1 Tax=Pseudokineococcus sp. 1T1Z-3 TaxID=3132745 RepID=UPI0030B3D620
MSPDERPEEEDRELREHLRGLDPAADLPPLAREDVAALLARITVTDPAVRDGEHDVAPGDADVAPGDADVVAADELADRRTWRETRSSGSTRRRRALGAVVGLAAATAVVVAGVSLGRGTGASTVPLAAGGVQPGAPASLCAEVDVQALEATTSAVAAETLAVEDGQVRLEVTEVFRGDLQVGDTLTVPQGDPMTAVVDGASLTYDVGTTYLLSTVPTAGSSADQAAGAADAEEQPDLAVANCGRSGPDGGELRDLYEQAFGG